MRVSPYHQTKVVNAFTAASISSNTTTAGQTIDLATTPGDWRSVLITAIGGTITDGTYTLTVTESDSSSTGFTAVTGAEVQGPSSTITATGGTAEIAYTGNKRYVRLAIVSTAVTTGGSLSARAILFGTASGMR